MQRWIVFIVLLAVSCPEKAAGCSFYPYDEDVRYRMLNPDAFGYSSYKDFYYTANYFGWERNYFDGNNVPVLTKVDENIEQWGVYCKGRVDKDQIRIAVYELSIKELQDSQSVNGMVLYFRSRNDTAALKYLVFAKNCEIMNGFYSDPWERNASYIPVEMFGLQSEALDLAKDAPNEELRQRYAFLSIRLCYYTGIHENIKGIYADYFLNRKHKTAIDYWAMHFRAITEHRDTVLQSYYAAQVFANAPEKRFAIHGFFDKRIPVSSMMRYAKTNKERAAIWLMKGIKNPGRALFAMQQMYRYDRSSEGLSFLLFREMSKMEDWIYTPYYTYFGPSVNLHPVSSYQERYALYNLDNDYAYAKQVLKFVKMSASDKVQNPIAWKAMEAYLYQMLKKPDESTAILTKLEQHLPKNTAMYDQLQMLKAFPMISSQQKGKTIIPAEFYTLIMQQHWQKNYRFLFGLAKELEFKGNTLDAALLLSHINENNDGMYGDDFYSKFTYWRSSNNRGTVDYANFFSNGFSYLDAEYNLTQVKELVDAAQNNRDTDTFTVWKYKSIRAELPRFQDLLATKYVRRNDLKNALAILKEIPDTLWKSVRYDYKYLDASPFYTNLYNEHSHTKADSTHYTKVSILETLLEHLAKAGDTGSKERDLHYFLAANCYLNMGFYGNSWMMSRYGWSCQKTHDYREDDDNFYKCKLAKFYYLKAKEHSRSDKFAALCLRMAGRCEKFNIMYEHEKYSDSRVFNANRYYAQLKKQYPNYYDDLISNCNAFEEYYSAR